VRFLYNAETREKTLLLEEKEFHSPRSFANLGLTKRETEILFLITQGKTDDVIATLCNISLRTVHKHVENIYTKLGVETRTGAMLAALKLL
jgi:DNA-binding NarL/FixJ family response regulator